MHRMKVSIYGVYDYMDTCVISKGRSVRVCEGRGGVNAFVLWVYVRKQLASR